MEPMSIERARLVRTRSGPAKLSVFVAAWLLLPVVFTSLDVVGRPRRSAQETASAPSKSSAEVARALSSRNSLQRREAAEELARLVAIEHVKLVEGYRLQERDARVRLALDWALYRMGKSEALFQLVGALDSSRYAQTLGYLSQLESPEPLYIFLKRTNGNTQVRLLEVLARIGDSATLEHIRPLASSLDPVIADAAKFAEREITLRLAEAPIVDPKRPRQVGKKENETP